MLNMANTNGYQGLVGFGIREMNATEFNDYCTLSKPKPFWPPLTDNLTFSADFWLRAYTSSCYHNDFMETQWESTGNEVYQESNRTLTYCQSNHLTEFAAGWMSYTIDIDKTYSWPGVNFFPRPTVYITVIIVSCLLILLAIWARWMDRRDVKRLGVTALPDNDPNDHYLYEIVTFTSSRPNAGTDSKVSMVISGQYDETGEKKVTIFLFFSNQLEN